MGHGVCCRPAGQASQDCESWLWWQTQRCLVFSAHDGAKLTSSATGPLASKVRYRLQVVLYVVSFQCPCEFFGVLWWWQSCHAWSEISLFRGNCPLSPPLKEYRDPEATCYHHLCFRMPVVVCFNACLGAADTPSGMSLMQAMNTILSMWHSGHGSSFW